MDAIGDAELFLDAEFRVGPAAGRVVMRGQVTGLAGPHALVRVAGDVEPTLIPSMIGPVAPGQEVFVSFEKPRGMFISGVSTSPVTGALAADQVAIPPGLAVTSYEEGNTSGLISAFVPVYDGVGAFLGYMAVFSSFS